MSLALYRRWRPQTFDEVVGQEYIKMALKNQVKNNTISHAYLFCGIRGTGKTTMAKIMAKAVNCLNNRDGNPCNECEVCKALSAGNCYDVVEIDAASNNSVDDIRELRENVKFLPSTTKYKVYIIDEVHMLSQGAFNALLKTLEEPPAHVIFILATTEPHKLPATILSRCQRFDFKRIPYDKVKERLQFIIKESNFEIEDKALDYIVRCSDGALRDAISLLDQCMAYSNNLITFEDVLNLIGAPPVELLFDVSDAILKKDIPKLIKIVDDIIVSGKDLSVFLRELILHFRNILMFKMADGVEEVINLPEEILQRYKSICGDFSKEYLYFIIEELSRREGEMRWFSDQRILLEMAFISISNRENFGDYKLEEVIKRLERLEEAIGLRGEIPRKEPSKISEDRKEEALRSEPQKSHLSIQDIKKKWSEFLLSVKKEKVSVYALLKEGIPFRLENNILVILFRQGYGFHLEGIMKKENKTLIEKVLFDFFGVQISIEGRMEEKNPEDKSKKAVEEIINLFGPDKVEIIDE